MIMPMRAPLNERQMRQRFWLAAAGSLLAGLAVALAAYAAHASGLDAETRAGLSNACLIALAHGVALAALGPLAVRRMALLGLAAIGLGTLLFTGSVAAAALGWGPSTLAPAGGVLMIVGWLAHALGQWRR